MTILDELMRFLRQLFGVVEMAMSNVDPRRMKIVDVAEAQVGKPYTHAEVHLDDPDPPGFDCSELVQWVYAQAGLQIVDGARAQYRALRPIPTSEVLPGDLVFLADGPQYSADSISHVGIVAADGVHIVEASKSAGKVRMDRTVQQWESWPSYVVLAGRHGGLE